MCDNRTLYHKGCVAGNRNCSIEFKFSLLHSSRYGRADCKRLISHISNAQFLQETILSKVQIRNHNMSAKYFCKL